MHFTKQLKQLQVNLNEPKSSQTYFFRFLYYIFLCIMKRERLNKSNTFQRKRFSNGKKNKKVMQPANDCAK